MLAGSRVMNRAVHIQPNENLAKLCGTPLCGVSREHLTALLQAAVLAVPGRGGQAHGMLLSASNLEHSPGRIPFPFLVQQGQMSCGV